MHHGPLTLLLALTAAAGFAQAAQVDMRLTPPDQTACIGEIIEIDVVLQSDGATAQSYDAVDAIITWDPAVLALVGAVQSNADIVFFVTGFLPDGDGINTDLTDGDALWTGLTVPGQLVAAPAAPGEMIVTTLRFQTLAAIDPALVQMPAALGTFGESRVLLSGATITGELGPAAEVTTTATCPGDCPADLDMNGVVGFNDLNLLLSQWGPCPGCSADFGGDDVVGFADLNVMLAAWGPCAG